MKPSGVPDELRQSLVGCHDPEQCISQSSAEVPWQMQVYDGVGTCELPSWRCFARFVSEEIGTYTTYIYRGQRKASWDLVPKIDRPPLGPLNIEEVKAHLNRFKLGCRGRKGSARPVSDDEWWALGQHYGLATPLLDWTASPFVAAYFAFASPDPADGPRAVFALSRKAVERRGSDVYIVVGPPPL